MYLYLLAATQIIIEMLPISSSGHLQLLEALFKKNTGIDKSFYYFLHGPTLLIITGYFFSTWWHLIFGPNGIAWNLILCILIADIITFLIYLLLNKIKIRFPLGLGFIITAAALFSTAWCASSKSIEFFDFSDAAILGLVQGLAVLPGISRLAFTCSIGCWLGFSLPDAFLLSWTMQVPLMAAAFGKSLKDLYELGALTQVLNLPMGLVMLGSSGISFILLYGVGQMTQNNTWYLFGFYMLVPLIIWTYMVRYDC